MDTLDLSISLVFFAFSAAVGDYYASDHCKSGIIK